MKTWILVANASEAYLYTSENLYAKEIQAFKKWRHPQSREKGSELISDQPGRYPSGTYEHSHPKEVEAETFARELIDNLRKGLSTHNYKQLIVIASPHFYGLMHKHIDFKVDNFVHIPKDYTKLKSDEIIEHIHKWVYG